MVSSTEGHHYKNGFVVTGTLRPYNLIPSETSDLPSYTTVWFSINALMVGQGAQCSANYIETGYLIRLI